MTVTMRPKRIAEPIHRKATPKTAAAARAATDLLAQRNGNGHAGNGKSTTLPDGIRQFDPAAAGDPADETGVEANRLPAMALCRESNVSTHQVHASADNPRKAFDDAALQELAESIRQHGLIEPLVVRPMKAAHQYELVCGERRLRACKLAGVTSVHVRVADLSDAQVAEIRLAENIARQDLTAIEEARGMQEMIERFGYTQEQLGQKLGGLSQSHVANRLRLLKLPKAWQDKIITREIPPTHARVVARFADHPTLLKEIHDDLFKNRWDPAPLALKAFEEAVDNCVENTCQVIVGSRYSKHAGRSVDFFEPTDAQRAKLGIVTVGKTEYAVDTVEWGKLQDAHELELAVDEPKTKAAKGKKPKPLTPAQEKAKAAKVAKQHAQRLATWRTNWLRFLLHREVMGNARLALAAVLIKLDTRAETLPNRTAELLRVDKSARRSSTLLAAIAAAPQPIEILVQHVADWLWYDEEPRDPQGNWRDKDSAFNSGEVEALAVAAGIDLAAAWKKEMAGPLTRAYFHLHGKDQLVTFAGELGIRELNVPDEGVETTVDKASKTELAIGLSGHAKAFTRLPKCIKPVAAAAGKKKRGAS